MGKIFLGVMVAIFSLPGWVLAHDLAPSCKDGDVSISYENGAPAQGATIYIINDDGKVIRHGKTDQNGSWSVPQEPLRMPQAIVVKTMDSHVLEIPWQDVLAQDCNRGKGKEKSAHEHDTKRVSFVGSDVYSGGVGFKGRS